MLAPQRGLIAIVQNKSPHPKLNCSPRLRAADGNRSLTGELQASVANPGFPELSNFYCLPGRAGGSLIGLAIFPASSAVLLFRNEAFRGRTVRVDYGNQSSTWRGSTGICRETRPQDALPRVLCRSFVPYRRGRLPVIGCRSVIDLGQRGLFPAISPGQPLQSAPFFSGSLWIKSNGSRNRSNAVMIQ